MLTGEPRRTGSSPGRDGGASPEQVSVERHPRRRVDAGATPGEVHGKGQLPGGLRFLRADHCSGDQTHDREEDDLHAPSDSWDAPPRTLESPSSRVGRGTSTEGDRSPSSLRTNDRGPFTPPLRRRVVEGRQPLLDVDLVDSLMPCRLAGGLRHRSGSTRSPPWKLGRGEGCASRSLADHPSGGWRRPPTVRVGFAQAACARSPSPSLVSRESSPRCEAR